MFFGLIRKVVYDAGSEIDRVCFPANLHMLLQYLLISDITQYDKTFFFVHDQIQSSIKNRMRYRCEFNYGSATSPLKKSMYNFVFWLLKKRLYSVFPYIANARFYLADHLVMGWVLACRHKYYLLEDGEGNYRRLRPLNHMSLIRYLMSEILFHPFPSGYWGRSRQCLGRLLSRLIPAEFDDSDVPISQVSMEELWLSASVEKKEKILWYFALDKDRLLPVFKRPVLLLTQPFSEDGVCSEEVKIESYRNVISRYNPASLVIKTHPRERTNYKNYFDEKIAVVDEPIPMELFGLLGASFSEVVSVSSTAAYQFRSKADVRMIGDEAFFIDRLKGCAR